MLSILKLLCVLTGESGWGGGGGVSRVHRHKCNNSRNEAMIKMPVSKGSTAWGITCTKRSHLTFGILFNIKGSLYARQGKMGSLPFTV